MAEVTSHPPGAFCWPELATTDQAGATTFYRTLFGWQLHDVPMAPGDSYSMFQIDGKDVAAACTLRPEQRAHGVPPHWMSYISTASADEAAKKADTLGGKVIVQPFDVFDVGRMAVIEDPTGASFSVWQAKSHIGARRVNEPNTLCWTELATRDTESATGFYTRLFGWSSKSDEGPIPYTEFMNGGAPHAGMMQMPGDMAGVPPHWMPYFAVTDCDRSATRARELGARLKMPPTDIPKVGRFAVIQDPQGAVFAIIALNAAA